MDKEGIPLWKKDWEESMQNETEAEGVFYVFEERFKELGIEIKNSKVLETGSGKGVFLDYLQKQGVNVVGIDVRPRGKTEGLPIVKALIEQLPFPDESFDIILSNLVFDANVYRQNHHLMMKEINRVLKHGGIYAATGNDIDHTVENLTFIPDPKKRQLVDIFCKS